MTLKAQDSDWMQSQKTSDSGEFEFTAVPLGNYTVTVALKGFEQQQQSVTVKSSTNPVLHFRAGTGHRQPKRGGFRRAGGCECDNRFGDADNAAEPERHSGNARGGSQQ